MIILPGDPEFDQVLGMTMPLDLQQKAAELSGEYCLVARAGSGILEAVSFAEAQEYMLGGEYDERLTEFDLFNDVDFDEDID